MAFVLAIFVFLVPFSRTLPTTSNVVVVVLLLGVLAAVGSRGYLSVTRLQLWALLLLGAGIVSHVFATGFSHFTVEHISKIKTFGLVGTVVLSSVIALRGRSRTKYIWGVVAVVVALVGPLSLLKITVGTPIGYGPAPARTYGLPIPAIPRAIGVTIPNGAYGVVASVGVSFLLGVIRTPSVFYPDRDATRLRILAAILLSGIAVAVFIGQSRSTVLALGAVFGVYGLVVLSDAADRIGVPTVVGSTVLAAGLILPRVVSVVLGVVTERGGSVSNRIQQYTYAVRLLSEHPLSGVGAGYFLSRSEFYVHNLWLGVGVWSGLPGLVSWTLLFALVGYRSLRYVGSPDGRVRTFGLVMTAATIGVVVELLLYPGFNDTLGLALAALVGPSRLRDP